MSNQSINASQPSSRIDQIQAALRDQIEAGAFGTGGRLPAIQQLARDFNATPYQAREAVLNLARAGVLETRRGAGTFITEPPTAATPDQPPATSRGQRVALLMWPSGDDPAARFHAALNDALAGTGITPVPQAWQPERALDCLEHAAQDWVTNPPAAAVIDSGNAQVLERLERLRPHGMRVIEVFHHWGDRPTFHEVSLDYEQAWQMAADHLVDQGHERIGLITHRRPARTTGALAPGHTHRGQAHGVLIFARRVRERLGRGAISIHRESGSPRDRLDDVVRWLDRPDRPTSIFGQDFRIASVIRAAERLGLRVPRDLEVLGVGNTVWAEEFAFPSFDLRINDVARHVADLLMRDRDPLQATQARVILEPFLFQR